MDSPSLVILRGAYVPDIKGRIDRRFDRVQTLELLSAGRLHLWIDHQFFHLQAPCFWATAPGIRYRYHRAPDCDRWDHRYVGFRGSMVEVWRASGLMPFGPQSMPDDEDYFRRFDQMLGLSNQFGYWAQRRAVNLLEMMLLALADARVQQLAEQVWLGRVFERLAQIKGTPQEYQALADDLATSVPTLRRRFRQSTGVPLHTWVLRHRINQARQLLEQTDIPLKAIAARLRYRDVYFFSRQFQRQVGLAPGAYRRAVRAARLSPAEPA